MPSPALRAPAVKPDVPVLLSRARAIGDIARQRAAETEANRRVSDDVIQMIREAELYRILQPQAYGGFEYGFDVLIEANAMIGRGCGSTAWVFSLGNIHQWLAAQLLCPHQCGIG